MMKRKTLFHIAEISFQVLATLFILCSIYMLFAVLDNDGMDFINIAGLATIQPLMALILSGITIIICMVIGLPIRINKKLNYWWSRNFYLSITGTMIGAVLLFLSFHPNFTNTVYLIQDGETISKKIPNVWLSISGWFVTAFSVLHFFPITLIINFF